MSTPDLPQHDLYYGGAWHAPLAGGYADTTDPASGQPIARVAIAGADDVDAAVIAATEGFRHWKRVTPVERGKALRAVAGVIRANAGELAATDAANGGNPVGVLINFMEVAAENVDYFAGLVTEIKGDSIPMGPGRLNVTVREPLGVVARIVAFNHPLLFSSTRLAAAIAAGNAVIVKPSEQAPLSALRLAELTREILPPGVLSVLSGGREAGQALAAHHDIAKISLIGSGATAKAVMRTAAETLKPVLFELGGKNALIAAPDADPAQVAAAAVDGMNLAWAGQSCGSTSRAFVHESIYDDVVERIVGECDRFRPGLPGDPATTMGAIVSPVQHQRVMALVASGIEEGARLVLGGVPPADADLAGGTFLPPTVFADVTPSMRIAREEIFGPVLSVLRWRDEDQMLADVNALDYGLTCSIWSPNIDTALRWASDVEAGYVWVNEVARHFLGAPYGGYKQSGIGREESIAELFEFTQEKNIHIKFRA
jgi:betaine-aldehyde dehydrogenase